MFENNKNYKDQYKRYLSELTRIGCDFKNDDDKIKALGIINNLKNIGYKIEPTDSIEYCKKYWGY